MAGSAKKVLFRNMGARDKNKNPGETGVFRRKRNGSALAGLVSALAGLVALLRLVDDVDAALAAHQLVVAVTRAQRLE